MLTALAGSATAVERATARPAARKPTTDAARHATRTTPQITVQRLPVARAATNAPSETNATSRDTYATELTETHLNAFTIVPTT
jgi:hypothetical protein